MHTDQQQAPRTFRYWRNRVFCCHGWRMGNDWGFWFRIFGAGLAVSTLIPCFSQRMHITRYVKIGRIKIEYLHKIK